VANENLFAFGGVFFKVAKCYNLKAPRFSLGGAGAYLSPLKLIAYWSLQALKKPCARVRT